MKFAIGDMVTVALGSFRGPNGCQGYPHNNDSPCTNPVAYEATLTYCLGDSGPEHGIRTCNADPDHHPDRYTVTLCERCAGEVRGWEALERITNL